MSANQNTKKKQNEDQKNYGGEAGFTENKEVGEEDDESLLIDMDEVIDILREF